MELKPYEASKRLLGIETFMSNAMVALCDTFLIEEIRRWEQVCVV